MKMLLKPGELPEDGIIIATENAAGNVYMFHAANAEEIQADWEGGCETVPENDARVFLVVRNGFIWPSIFYQDFESVMLLLIRLDLASSSPKYRRFECDQYDPVKEVYPFRAWLRNEKDYLGQVIAEVNLGTGHVKYLDPDARTDEEAQAKISEFIKLGHILTEEKKEEIL